MIKFYNNIENEEKFLAIIDCLKQVQDINYEGFDTSDPLDEMNDFMNSVGFIDDDGARCWFSEIYDRWMADCCSFITVETINESFKAALNGKHFYDVDNFLNGWDKDLVEYVLNEKEDFIILNDKDDYNDFLYKYEVTARCPWGYYEYDLDIWCPYKNTEAAAAELLEDSVMIDYYENDDGNYEDDFGNVIDVKEEAAAYAESWLQELNYKDISIN